MFASSIFSRKTATPIEGEFVSYWNTGDIEAVSSGDEESSASETENTRISTDLCQSVEGNNEHNLIDSVMKADQIFSASYERNWDEIEELDIVKSQFSFECKVPLKKRLSRVIGLQNHDEQVAKTILGICNDNKDYPLDKNLAPTVYLFRGEASMIIKEFPKIVVEKVDLYLFNNCIIIGKRESKDIERNPTRHVHACILLDDIKAVVDLLLSNFDFKAEDIPQTGSENEEMGFRKLPTYGDDFFRIVTNKTSFTLRCKSVSWKKTWLRALSITIEKSRQHCKCEETYRIMRTCHFSAAVCGDEIMLSKALKRDDALHINTPDPMYCKTALHYAVENGNHDCVRFLLDNGADPNARDIHDKQPGYYGNNINILDMLSSSGGDTNGFPALWREFEPLKVKSKMKNASSDLKQGIKNLHERQEKIDTLNDTVESMNSSAHEYASLALAAKKVILLQRLGKPGKKKFTL